jgi:hypothetical protein
MGGVIVGKNKWVSNEDKSIKNGKITRCSTTDEVVLLII